MKRDYTPVTKKPVHMDTLRRNLLVLAGLPIPREHVSTKLPTDMEGTFNNVALVSSWGQVLLGYYTIVVVKTAPQTETNKWTGITREVKSSKHRIFIKIGDRLIPAGRANQAKL